MNEWTYIILSLMFVIIVVISIILINNLIFNSYQEDVSINYEGDCMNNKPDSECFVIREQHKNINIDYMYHITPKQNVDNILSNGIIRQRGNNRKRCTNDTYTDDRIFLTNFSNIDSWIKTLNYNKEDVAVFQVKQNYIDNYKFSWYHYKDGGNEISIYNKDIEVDDIKLFMIGEEIVDSFERKDK